MSKISATCTRCGDTAGKHRYPGNRGGTWRAIGGWIKLRQFDLLGREKPGARAITLCPTCLRELGVWLRRFSLED